MPIHHVPRASLHEDLLDIVRHQGERIMSIVADALDPEFYFVHTEYQTGEYREVAS